MKTNSIQQSSFRGLHIDHEAYMRLLPQSEIFLRSERRRKILFKKIDNCMHNAFVDIFVKKDCSVFLTDKTTNKTSQVFSHYQPKRHYFNFFSSLIRAGKIKRNYEKLGKKKFTIFL